MIERTSSAASGRRAPVFICLAFYLLAAYCLSFVQSATVAQTHAQHMQGQTGGASKLGRTSSPLAHTHTSKNADNRYIVYKT
jgi:hypothetical protein